MRSLLENDDDDHYCNYNCGKDILKLNLKIVQIDIAFATYMHFVFSKAHCV